MTEQQLQRALIQHIEARRRPDVFYYAVPNGGYRRPIEAKILKSQGVRAGVPDLAFVANGRHKALELKTEKGRLSIHQQECLVALRNAGAIANEVYGLDDAIEWLEFHELVK